MNYDMWLAKVIYQQHHVITWSGASHHSICPYPKWRHPRRPAEKQPEKKETSKWKHRKNLKSKICMARKKSMVDIKNKVRWNLTRGYPSQCPKGPTQVCKAGVLIPVEFQNWRCRSRYSERNSYNGFSRADNRRVTSSDDRLGWDERRHCWTRIFSRRKKLQGGPSLSSSSS